MKIIVNRGLKKEDKYSLNKVNNETSIIHNKEKR
jgi:hypothetical protein